MHERQVGVKLIRQSRGLIWKPGFNAFVLVRPLPNPMKMANPGLLGLTNDGPTGCSSRVGTNDCRSRKGSLLFDAAILGIVARDL